MGIFHNPMFLGSGNLIQTFKILDLYSVIQLGGFLMHDYVTHDRVTQI